jgi:type IV pilus assembly protein PilO
MKKEFLANLGLQEKAAALTPAQRVLLVIGTLAVLGALFYFIQYKPQAETNKRLRLTLADQEKKLTELKKAAADVELFQKDLAKVEEELAQALVLLPDRKEIPGLLENVSQLGAEVGLENLLFQPQPEQVQEFYATVPIRLDLIGTYHELGLFLDRVSKLNRILKVENLNMVRQGNSPRLQVGFTVMTYRFIDQPVKEDASKKK